MLKEIKPGIFLITSKSRFPAFKPPVNIYILAGEKSLIFDSGYGLEPDVKIVKRQIDKILTIQKKSNKPCDITWILPSHSHADHFSGAMSLKKATGAMIALTPLMQRVLESRKTYMSNYRDDEDQKEGLKKILSIIIDLIYEKSVGMRFIKKADSVIDDNSCFNINGRTWRIIPMPGHSSDHVGLYCEKEGILLGGDNVLRSVITWLGPPDSDLRQYENTLKSMLELPNLRLILPAHGSKIANPCARIREILAHRKKRTTDVLSIIKNKGKSGSDIRGIQDRLYPKGGFWMRFNSEGWIRLTLKELKNKGIVEEKKKGKKKIYKFISNH